MLVRAITKSTRPCLKVGIACHGADAGKGAALEAGAARGGGARWHGARKGEVELLDGTLRGPELSRGTCVAWVHPSEITQGAADKSRPIGQNELLPIFFARSCGFRNAQPLSHRGSAATWHKSQCSALRPREPQLNKSRRPRLGCLEPERHQPSCGGVADSTAERDPWSTTPGARPAPAADHTAVACPHPRHDTAERDHGEAAGGATKARDRAGLEQASKRRHLAGAPGSLGDVLDRPGRRDRSAPDHVRVRSTDLRASPSPPFTSVISSAHRLHRRRPAGQYPSAPNGLRAPMIGLLVTGSVLSRSPRPCADSRPQ